MIQNFGVSLLEVSKKSKKIINKLDRKVRNLNGYLESAYSHPDGELMTLYLYSRLPLSDETCVAAIDLLTDSRYGHPTFNVDIYNECFHSGIDDLKQSSQLQVLAVKYAHKLAKHELGWW